MDKKYTSLESTIRNVVRGNTGAAQDNRSLESKIRSVVLKEEKVARNNVGDRVEINMPGAAAHGQSGILKSVDEDGMARVHLNPNMGATGTQTKMGSGDQTISGLHVRMGGTHTYVPLSRLKLFYPDNLDEEVGLEEARRKSAASLGFISTNAGHGVTASSEPYGDSHLPVVTTSSGNRVDVGHNPYPTPELAQQGAEEFIKNTYTRQGTDPVRGFRALSNHHRENAKKKTNEEVSINEAPDDAAPPGENHLSVHELFGYLRDYNEDHDRSTDPDDPDEESAKESRADINSTEKMIRKIHGQDTLDHVRNAIESERHIRLGTNPGVNNHQAVKDHLDAAVRASRHFSEALGTGGNEGGEFKGIPPAFFKPFHVEPKVGDAHPPSEGAAAASRNRAKIASSETMKKEGYVITPSGRKPLINEAEKARQAQPATHTPKDDYDDSDIPEPEKNVSYTDGKNVTSTEAEMKDAARKAFMNKAVGAISSAMKEEVGLEEGSAKFAKIMARTAAARGEPITTDTTELEKKHAELLQTSRDAAGRAKKAREDYENLARQYGIPVEESAYMPAGTNIKQPSAGSSLGDRAIDTALDIAPFIGTYRDYKRGNYGMAALGAAMDAATLFSLGAGTPATTAARLAAKGGAKLAAGAEARALAGSEARAVTRTSSRGTPEPVKGKTGKNSNERKGAEAESRLDAIDAMTSGVGGSGGSPMPMPTLKVSSQPSAMGAKSSINVHRAGARKIYGQEIHYNEYSPDGNYIGEDADSERSAIENVARPNSKNKLTKQAEIKTKILEDTARRKSVILRAKEENKNGKDGGNSDVETKPELKRADVNEQEITVSDVAGTLAKGAVKRAPGVGAAMEISDKNSELNTRINKGDIVGAAIRGAETVANQVPGGGTLVGAGLGAVNTARDFIKNNPSRVSAYGTSGMQKSDAKSWDDNNPQRNAKIGTPSQFPSK